MSFTLYAKSFPPKYAGCCRTTPENNEIGQSVISIFITGFEYSVLPILYDITGARISILDVQVYQHDGTLTFRIPCVYLKSRRFYIETSDDVMPTIYIGTLHSTIKKVCSIRDGYYLWHVSF